MDEKIAKILKWFNDSQSPPHTIELWPTFRCNLNCLFCDYRKKRDDKDSFIDYENELSTRRWVEIIEEAGKLGVKKIRLVGGGEPLFYRNRAISMIEKIKSMGMIGYLTTNGTLFDEHIISLIVKTGWEHVEISVDGPDAETHDYLRGVDGAFDKILKSLNVFSSLKKKFNIDYPKISFSTVVTNRNYNKLKKLLELAKKYDCDVNFLQLNDTTPEAEKLKLNHGQEREMTEFMKSINLENTMKMSETTVKNTNKMNIGPKKYENKILNLKCYEPWYYMQIISNGKVGPCCTTYCNKSKDSMKTQNIMDMWLSKHMQKIRKNILKDKLKDQCLNCPLEMSHRTKTIRNRLLHYFS